MLFLKVLLRNCGLLQFVAIYEWEMVQIYKYNRTSVAQTLMACLPLLFKLVFESLGKILIDAN